VCRLDPLCDLDISDKASHIFNGNGVLFCNLRRWLLEVNGGRKAHVLNSKLTEVVLSH
jgi:hypothetical protein